MDGCDGWSQWMVAMVGRDRWSSGLVVMGVMVVMDGSDGWS